MWTIMDETDRNKLMYDKMYSTSQIKKNYTKSTDFYLTQIECFCLFILIL